MKGIKRYIKSRLVGLNLKPVKVVVLPTGLTCLHFSNGTIKVI